MRLTEWGDRPNAWPSSGVGGGRPAPPSSGVKHVDGYEINRTMIDFLQRDFRDFNAVTTRPEVRLIHDDARNGIAHSGQRRRHRYRSIDTYGTASGEFVLSENPLYTREGWRVFLEHLTPPASTMSGISPMLGRNSPARSPCGCVSGGRGHHRRGVSYRAAAVRQERGVRGVRRHGRIQSAVGTILVPRIRSPAEEVRRLAAESEAAGGTLIAAPGVAPEGGLAKTARPRDARGRHCRKPVQYRAADRSQASSFCRCGPATSSAIMAQLGRCRASQRRHVMIALCR